MTSADQVNRQNCSFREFDPAARTGFMRISHIVRVLLCTHCGICACDIPAKTLDFQGISHLSANLTAGKQVAK